MDQNKNTDLVMLVEKAGYLEEYNLLTVKERDNLNMRLNSLDRDIKSFNVDDIKFGKNIDFSIRKFIKGKEKEYMFNYKLNEEELFMQSVIVPFVINEFDVNIPQKLYQSNIEDLYLITGVMSIVDIMYKYHFDAEVLKEIKRYLKKDDSDKSICLLPEEREYIEDRIQDSIGKKSKEFSRRLQEDQIEL